MLSSFRLFVMITDIQLYKLVHPQYPSRAFLLSKALTHRRYPELPRPGNGFFVSVPATFIALKINHGPATEGPFQCQSAGIYGRGKGKVCKAETGLGDK